MKIVVLIVRLLLGLVFFVFGLNAFLQFLKGPIPGGLAGQFLQALFQSHYVLAIGAVQAVGGALLLVNRYVPLALTILGPVIVNILLYHMLLNHEGIGGALIVAVFWFVLFFHSASIFPGSLPQRLRLRRDSDSMYFRAPGAGASWPLEVNSGANS